MSAAEKLEKLAKALSVEGEMLAYIHSVDPTLDGHVVLKLCKTFLSMVKDADMVIEEHKAATWQAIDAQNLEKLMQLLRSHPEVLSVDVITASDLERMAKDEIH